MRIRARVRGADARHHTDRSEVVPDVELRGPARGGLRIERTRRNVAASQAVGLLTFAPFVMLKPLHLRSLDATIIGPECHARCGNDAFVVATCQPEAKLRYN